jgi:hypothetical protein
MNSRGQELIRQLAADHTLSSGKLLELLMLLEEERMT